MNINVSKSLDSIVGQDCILVEKSASDYHLQDTELRQVASSFCVSSHIIIETTMWGYLD